MPDLPFHWFSADKTPKWSVFQLQLAFQVHLLYHHVFQVLESHKKWGPGLIGANIKPLWPRVTYLEKGKAIDHLNLWLCCLV